MQWPLFSEVPPEDVRRLLAISRRRTFRKGEVVFHRDDLAESLHLITKGHFAVRITTQLGDTVLLDVLGPGEAFGELALLLPGARRTATVEALAEGETRTVFRDDFALLRSEHPSVTDVLLRLLAEQLSRVSDRLVEAHYVDAETRVLRRVCDLARRFGGGATGGVAVPLTQDELASMAGTSRATVNRVLREEERRGSVRLGRGHTVVLALGELERRCR